MAIGVDIEDIERFKGKPLKFYERIFSQAEQEYCLKFREPESHFAARFCAKEAVIKALTALNIKGISYKDIEVFRNENKCPQVRILKKLEKEIKFEISLSHDRTKAIAYVTAKIV